MRLTRETKNRIARMAIIGERSNETIGEGEQRYVETVIPKRGTIGGGAGGKGGISRKGGVTVHISMTGSNLHVTDDPFLFKPPQEKLEGRSPL